MVKFSPRSHPLAPPPPSRDLEVPVEPGGETLTLSFLEEEGRLGANQVEEKVATEDFEEEKVVSEGYEDVVFYLSEGLCYTEAGQVGRQGWTGG